MSHVYEKVTIPMRDGVRLAASLFRVVEEPAPTLLLRTPYGIGVNPLPMPDVVPLLDAGFSVLWVACRGTAGSEGTLRMLVDDADDGWDTVEWLVAQPWSDGTIGTYGGSYHGMTQWAIAAQAPPALRASVVTVSALNPYRGAWYHPGGGLSLSLGVAWHLVRALEEELAANGPGERSAALMAALADGTPEQLAVLGHTPLAETPLLATDERFATLLAHETHDEYWQGVDRSGAVPAMTQPVLFVSGWYDLLVVEQLRDFERYRKEASSESARNGSRLVVGPWRHDYGSPVFPGRDFGSQASALAADVTGEHVRHLTRALRPKVGTPAETSPVRLFVMGVNQWRDEPDWPLPDTEYLDHYLRGDGTLSAQPGPEAIIEYDYDPRDPAPTTGGAHAAVHRQDGPVDQRALESRHDVLSFTGPVLEEDTEVTGYVTATLFVSSDALDTDFMVKLIDVHPDGRALNLCDGMLRARYRSGLTRPELMTPGQVYEIEVDMAATANVFLAGHRIRVDVTSSNFPRFDRNTNTGGRISEESLDDAVIAQNTLWTGPRHPSRLRLPIIRRS